MTPVSKVCAKARVEQFPDDFCAEDNMLFCKFCPQSIDIFRVDTIKEHIKSKVHMRKISSMTLFKSKEIRDEFILDFLKMCTLSDIPLYKIDKMRPFLLKYCKEGGSIPSVNCIWELHLPKLFVCYFAALKAKLA